MIDAKFAKGISTVVVYESVLRQYSLFVMNVCKGSSLSQRNLKAVEYRTEAGCSYNEAPTLNDVADNYIVLGEGALTCVQYILQDLAVFPASQQADSKSFMGGLLELPA